MVNRRSPPRAPLRIRPSNALFRGVTPRRLFPARPATPRAPVRNAERAAAVRIARMINGLPLGVRRHINYGHPMSVTTPYAASRMPRSFRR